MVIEIYKPEFSEFHETPIVTWEERRGGIRVATNMYNQYRAWLNAWTDPNRDKHAPAPAFWESHGPAICRALSHFNCHALIFEYESDRKVAYKWFTPTPERATAYKMNYFSICSVTAEGRMYDDQRVTLTTPYDEDVVMYFHASSMKDWIKPPPEEKKP